jgi:NAD+ diphosphatase
MTSPPEPDTRPHLGFAGSRIERAAELRADAATLAKLERDPRSRFYLIAGELVALKQAASGHDPLFDGIEARDLGNPTEMVFMGFLDGAARFAVALASPGLETLRKRSGIELLDLRSIAVRNLIDNDHLAALAEGKALINWHARHRFCANCGAKTREVEGGWRRDCRSCEVQHFPRTDPVVIMLAVAGERCLLGRPARFQAGMWSCLSGFVEPGETVEDAVRRETLEEAGIACGKVAYFASQPWPFPMSLMIGCYAQASSQEIKIDRTELEDARWFERSEVALMLAGRHPQGLTTPLPFAIAHHILRAFAEKGVEFD